MIIEIMFGTYLGIRLYEKYKKKQEQKREVEVEPESGTKDTANLTNSQTTLESEAKTNSPVKQYKHFANMSLLTMVLFGLRKIFPIFGPLGAVSYIYTAVPYMRDVEKSLVKNRKVNVDVLFFTADVLTLSVGQYFTAGFGLWMMHSGKEGVEKARDNSQKMITGIFEQLPQKVWVLMDNVEVEIPLKDVKSNDTLMVSAGGLIPVDGVITVGMASIDQRALTGEAQPAEKEVGDYVYANTIVITGRIHIRVEKSGEDTTAAKISSLILHSTDFKSRVQLKGEEWADKATLPMLLTAGISLPTFGPVTTAVFINSHIGNRIRFLAPLGTLKHISMAANNGILVKDGRALEGLCQVDTLIFDKTGTLTTDEPEVKRIVTCNSYKKNEILGFAAAAERKLTHPIARAILKKAEETNLTVQDVHDSQYRIGYGITVFIENKTIKVGSIRFMTGEGIVIPENIKKVTADSHEKGNTLVLVAVDNQIGGVIELEPQVRPEAKKIISRLRQQGVKHMAIVSGDHCHPTQKLAEELGMDEYFYDILPEEKSRIVEQLQQENRTVCFIGDGINDAIAMKKANVSISLTGATAIATDVAEVILMDGSLCYLDTLFDISKKLGDNLKKSLKLTVTPGLINLAGAFLFQYGILTSLVVNLTFSGIAIADVMKPLKAAQDQQEKPK